MKTVALVNNKGGGVGKITSAVNLAAGIAAGKRRVLLVDLDAVRELRRLDPTKADELFNLIVPR